MNKAKRKKANRHKNYKPNPSGLGIVGKSKYAKKKQEQARGKYRSTSPIRLVG